MSKEEDIIQSASKMIEGLATEYSSNASAKLEINNILKENGLS